MKLQSKSHSSWANGAVVYHIYPLSFKDSNGDGIGDLKGIIEKLDYLNDGTENSLGVDAIWLSPIYTSPMKDFGYDISDYYNIDPAFGDLEIFNELVRKCHERGVRVVMDFAANHTSVEHQWFVESMSSKDNPKRDWYIWRDGKAEGLPPNNWLSVFGGSAWECDKKTGQYYLHSFFKEQPDLNWRNNAVGREMEQVLEFWLHRGVDGFRLDAAYYLIKDDQFRDESPNPNYDPKKDDPYNALLHTYSNGRPETLETINAFCQVLGLHDDKFIVSEAYVDIPALTQLYGACANNLHAPVNFNLISMGWDAKTHKTFVDDFESSLTPNDLPTYVLGNHDRSRVTTRLGQERARLAAMLELTLRGMPFIYYGEEIGMEDTPIPQQQILDPLEKNVPGFNLGRDPERTPMQWNAKAKSGFTNAKPWLPINENYKTINVEKELSDPRSTLNLYRQLVHYRKQSPALLKGRYVPIDCVNDSIFAFVRQLGGDRILVILNFSNDPQTTSTQFHRGKVAISTYLDKEKEGAINLENLVLRPNEGYLIEISGN